MPKATETQQQSAAAETQTTETQSTEQQQTQQPTTETPADQTVKEKSQEKPQYQPITFRSFPFKNIVYGMPDGKHVEFHDGTFTAKTEAEADFLKSLPDFGCSVLLPNN